MRRWCLEGEAENKPASRVSQATDRGQRLLIPRGDGAELCQRCQGAAMSCLMRALCRASSQGGQACTRGPPIVEETLKVDFRVVWSGLGRPTWGSTWLCRRALVCHGLYGPRAWLPSTNESLPCPLFWLKCVIILLYRQTCTEINIPVSILFIWLVPNRLLLHNDG